MCVTKCTTINTYSETKDMNIAKSIQQIINKVKTNI